jgi:hypothetical protein
MPTLRNPRHERFAQLIAAGGSGSASYLAAGFRACRTPHGAESAASRLLRNGEVAKRLAELRAKAEAKFEQEHGKVVADVRFDRQRVLERLNELSRQAQLSKQWTAAVRAEELIGRASGIFVDRVEQDIDLDNPPPHLREKIEKWLEKIAFGGDDAALAEWRAGEPQSTTPGAVPDVGDSPKSEAPFEAPDVPVEARTSTLQ